MSNLNNIPVLPPIETIRTTVARAIERTKQARAEMFEKEKGRVYYDIIEASSKGNWTVEHKFPENCNYMDIKDLEKELNEQGFKAEFKSGIPRDSLEISWHTKE